jgi:hypothetical protein
MQDPKFVVRWDGKEEAVLVQQSDITRWEMQRAINGWPQQEDAWNLWATFVTFNALRRAGKIDGGMPFDVFVDQVEKIQLEGVDQVDPTQQAPTAD